MVWSSVGLLLAVSLVNTKGLSIHGEEEAAIQGDEVEQELEVSEVKLLGGIILLTFFTIVNQTLLIAEICICGHPGAGGNARHGWASEEGRPRNHQL